ncbi:hypothetical protein T4B_12210, partial [Trichinella pseudospiralis]
LNKKTCHNVSAGILAKMQFTILIIALSLLYYGNALPSRPYWDHTAKPPVKSTPNLDEFNKYEEAAAKADVSTARWVNGVTPVGTLNGSNVKNLEGVSMGRIGVDESNNSDLMLSSALDIVTTFNVLGLVKKIFRSIKEVLLFAGESAALEQFCVAEGIFESSELNESSASRSSPDENVPGCGVHRHTGKCSSRSISNSIFLSSSRSDSSFNRLCSINNCSTSLKR